MPDQSLELLTGSYVNLSIGKRIRSRRVMKVCFIMVVMGEFFMTVFPSFFSHYNFFQPNTNSIGKPDPGSGDSEELFGLLVQ